VLCTKCGKDVEHGGLFENIHGDKDFECVKCHPSSSRYREGPGQMNDYLPGGKKYTGALASGPVPEPAQ